MDVLKKIKKYLIEEKYEFTDKARIEMFKDGLMVYDVIASVINAPAIKKTIRSKSLYRKNKYERIYVIEGPTFEGIWIYTKGTFRKADNVEKFYIFISTKIAK